MPGPQVERTPVDSDDKFCRTQALTLAVHNREPDDILTGETQVERAKRYLKFLRPGYLTPGST